jgi:hypothetical protein
LLFRMLEIEGEEEFPVATLVAAELPIPLSG